MVEVGVRDQGVLDLDLLRHRQRPTNGPRVDEDTVIHEERRRSLTRPLTAVRPENLDLQRFLRSGRLATARILVYQGFGRQGADAGSAGSDPCASIGPCGKISIHDLSADAQRGDRLSLVPDRLWTRGRGRRRRSRRGTGSTSTWLWPESKGLTVTHIVETHLHADHVSGNQALAAKTGARIHIHPAAQAAFAHAPDRARRGAPRRDRLRSRSSTRPGIRPTVSAFS